MARKESEFERLLRAANDEETEAIISAAIRAGMLWRCKVERPERGDTACGWVNSERDRKCGDCGAKRPKEG